MKRFLISAGEISGDAYAAQVVDAVQKQTRARFLGLGGSELKKRGVRFLAPSLTGSIGFKGLASQVQFHLKLAKTMEGEAMKEEVQGALLVDYTGFHMVLGRRLRRRNIPVLHYIAPGVWFWGPWRASCLARWGIEVASIFPQETRIYAERGAQVHFVGHPLLSLLEPYRYREKDPHLLALLPGSRVAEVENLLPPLIEGAFLLTQRYPWLKVVVSQVADLPEELYEPAREVGFPLELDSKGLLGRASLAIAAAGTATLEAALLGTPMIIVYIADRLTSILARRLIRVPCIGLPNLILEESFFPELLQDQVTGPNLLLAASGLIEKGEQAGKKLQEVRDRLEGDNPPEQVARLLLEGGMGSGNRQKTS